MTENYSFVFLLFINAYNLSIFFFQVKTNHILTKLYVENLDPHSLAVDHQAFDIEFFKDLNFSEKSRSEILLWNKTPSLVNLQIHIFKHRLGATSASFMVDKVVIIIKINNSNS